MFWSECGSTESDHCDSLHVALLSSHALLTSQKSHFQFILITIFTERSLLLSLVTYSCRLLNYKSFSEYLTAVLTRLTKKFSFYNWIFIYVKFHVIVEGIILFFSVSHWKRVFFCFEHLEGRFTRNQILFYALRVQKYLIKLCCQVLWYNVKIRQIDVRALLDVCSRKLNYGD